MRTLRSRMKPLQREPIELLGGPGDGILLFVRPPLPRTQQYPCPEADHTYRLKEDLTGWRYQYRGPTSATSAGAGPPAPHDVPVHLS